MNNVVGVITPTALFIRGNFDTDIASVQCQNSLVHYEVGLVYYEVIQFIMRSVKLIMRSVVHYEVGLVHY